MDPHPLSTTISDGDEIMNKLLSSVVMALAIITAGSTIARADCPWTVSGTVKVHSQESELITKYGADIPLKGIKVKISGATIGWFDEWGTVTTDANGKFTLRISKG